MAKQKPPSSATTAARITPNGRASAATAAPEHAGGDSPGPCRPGRVRTAAGAGGQPGGLCRALAGARILGISTWRTCRAFPAAWASSTGCWGWAGAGFGYPGRGQPGAGKSTLLLQTMCHLAMGMDALYITGEESCNRLPCANRLGLPTDRLRMMSETNIETIVAGTRGFPARVVVVDSIQVVHTGRTGLRPGSVSQVRECAAYLTRFAKQSGTVLILVGHVTKDGSLAAPRCWSI